MGFSNLPLLWTAVLPVIVLLYYFFRRKYKDQYVSSTLLWNEVMQETKASPYLKHLQKNALLYLQLLALLLFVLALMNPFVTKTETAGDQMLWIVDTSATMLAGKGGTTTFDQHKEKMMDLAENLNGRPISIIATGEEPKTIVQKETDLSAIHRAIAKMEVTYEEEQLTKAIDMAHALIGDEAASIYLFTDSVERGELPIKSDNIQWIVKGTSDELENVAVTRFAATSHEDSSLALVQLKNQTKNDKALTLSILNAQKEILAEEELLLKAGEEVTKTYKNLPSSSILTASIDVEDDYKADNSMVALIGSGPSQIVVDQQMHSLVQKGFQALNEEVKIAPADQLQDVDDAIVVTNRTELLQGSKSPVVLIGRNDEKAEEINLQVDESEDALFSFSSLQEVYVSSIYPPFEDFATIATIGGKPFVQRSSKGDIVILTDIQSTDWPLHPSFPLFLWGIQNELTQGKTTLGAFFPNERRAVSLPSGEWTIYSSDNEYVSSLDGGSEFRAPMLPGSYTVRSNEEEKQFVVQLSSQEREIEEGRSFELGSVKQNREEEATKKPLLRWLLIPILLLLAIEWEVQRRRGFAN
ncbi:VWA domain-containing protein [Lysinibacillus yapensis]|uniref:VWA domain-containing protein n=1 Tax=Ureibacillus yapensis TaxID=2304605 RepID=A0A396S698_9BACL|nr:BatA and WFA domain-containing protein [Lysinibacillus yapensis]RHW31448.1 VWA domain-containing protein [Lysinibacillus yapensis]